MRVLAAWLLAPSLAAASPAHDIDGDGRDDAALDHHYLVYGGTAPKLDPALTPASPRTASLMFYTLEVVGDVDGDGFADVVLGDPGCPDYADDLPACEVGAIYLFRGGRKRLATRPSQTVKAAAKDTMFGNQVVPLGDVDGDRRADLAVVARDGIYLYLGSAKGLAPTPRKLPGTGTVVAIGDVDGDRRADVAVIENQHVTIYSAGDPARGTKLVAPRSTQFVGPGAHGDFDGDGFQDLAVTLVPVLPSGARLANQVAIYRGGKRGLTPTTMRLRAGDPRDEFGGALGAVGDLDGNRIDDLVVVATCKPFRPKTSSCEGSTAYVYLGSGRGLRDKPIATLAPARKNMMLTGGALIPLGDVDGDRKADFAFGAYVYRGNVRGIMPNPLSL